MAIEFNDALEALWYVEFRGGNWLAALSRVPLPGLGFKLLYRFRYYRDDDLTRRTKDVKNWMGLQTGDIPIKEALKKTALMASVVVQTAPDARLYQCFREGRSTEALWTAFTAFPFAHTEQLDGEAAEELGL